ncbi:MAG: hypothetical protein ACRC2T_11305 [Thermoguttaceae bacterium]
MYSKHIVLLFLFALSSQNLFASELAHYVNQGVDFYQKGDYDSAIAAFDKAEKISPKDDAVIFNQACALMAAKKTTQAVEKFRKTAFSEDKSLVCDSLINLGIIHIDTATALLTEETGDTPIASRAKIIAELSKAAKEFADCLYVDSQNNTARENLEMVRTWKTQLEEIWSKNEREKIIEDSSLLEYVKVLENEQRLVKQYLLEIKQLPESQRKFQRMFELGKKQAQVASEEKAVLANKINSLDAAELFPYTANANETISDQEVSEKRNQLKEFADKIVTNSTKAAEDFRTVKTPEFQIAIEDAVESLDSLRTELTDYETLVKLAAEMQDTLTYELQRESRNHDNLLWDQKFVLRWVPKIIEKANLLEALEQQRKLSESNSKQPDNVADDTNNHNENVDDNFNDSKILLNSEGLLDAENLIDAFEKSDTELLHESMQLAITLGPEVESLLNKAVKCIQEEKIESAQDYQVQARDFLRRIVEPLETKKEQSPKQSNDTNKQNSDTESNDDNKSDSEQNQDNSRNENNEPNLNDDFNDGSKNNRNNKKNTSQGNEQGENSDINDEDNNEPDEILNQRNGGINDDLDTTPEKQNKNEKPVNTKSSNDEITDETADGGELMPDDDNQNEGDMSEFEAALLQEKQKTDKENAETIIRAVKRRKQEAEKIRTQLRRMTLPNQRELKDW